MGQVVSTPFALTMTKRSIPPPTTTALGSAALALGAGQSAAFPIPSWGATGSGWNGAILAWCSRIHWDAVNRIGWLMCKEAQSTGDGKHKLIRYDEATNTITKVYDAVMTEGGGTGTGHGYDSAALDPVTGEFYFVQLYGDFAVVWTGSSWAKATGAVTNSGNPETSDGPFGFCWHPNLFGPGAKGMVEVRNTNVRGWRYSLGASSNFSALGSSGLSGLRYSSGVYCPALDAVIASQGESGQNTIIVRAGGAVSLSDVQAMPVYASAAVVTGNGDQKMNRLMPTPGGSACILESASPGKVWWLNPVTLRWVLQTWTHPLRLSDSSWPAAFVGNHEIYWAWRQQNGGNSAPSSLIWRPFPNVDSGERF